MRVAVIYYSMFNNGEYVAKKIQEKINNCDLIRIYPVKEYPSKGLRMFFHGGKGAMQGEMPELKEYDFDANKYDYIIIGSPVWASRITPPIRTFINDNRDKLLNKKIGAYVTSGGGCPKALDRLEDFLGKKIDNKLDIVLPLQRKNEDTDKKIDEFIERVISC